jgi:hypothetical protein
VSRKSVVLGYEDQDSRAEVDGDLIHGAAAAATWTWVA